MPTHSTNNPLFTVLIPTHNRADVLPFAIRSVLAQTMQDFELLIVGDGCTDNTAQVIHQFDDPRLRWFDLPKAPGFGYGNRNVALRQARGEFIAYMTHDDLWTADHLESFLPTFTDPQIDFAYSRPLWIIPNGKIAPGTFNLQHPQALHRFLTKQKNIIPSSCIVHRTRCFQKVGYWNDQLECRADWDMWVRIIEAGNRTNLAYLPDPTCLHFRANWRKEVAFFGEVERAWELFHNVDGFMPAPLKIAVPQGMTDQQALWNAMSIDPKTWTKEIRLACQLAIDLRIDQNDELLVRLMKELPTLQITGLTESLSRIAIAWRPLPPLRQLISLNNKIRRTASPKAPTPIE